MIQNIRSTVSEIDDEIRRHEWFDFHVLSFDGFKLIIAGSVDLMYYHKLEIIFENIFFVSGFLNVLYNVDTVYYYERRDLEKNERIAEFVKNKHHS